MPAAAGRSPLPAIAALVLATALSLALWGALFWQVGRTAASTATASTVTGFVVSCPSGPVGPGCVVRFADANGVVTERGIDRPGLVGVVEGDVVPLWVGAGGVVTVGGWRPWVDGGLLLILAVVMSAGAVHWFGRVLGAGDGYTDLDLRTDERGEERGRRAG